MAHDILKFDKLFKSLRKVPAQLTKSFHSLGGRDLMWQTMCRWPALQATFSVADWTKCGKVLLTAGKPYIYPDASISLQRKHSSYGSIDTFISNQRRSIQTKTTKRISYQNWSWVAGLQKSKTNNEKLFFLMWFRWNILYIFRFGD